MSKMCNCGRIAKRIRREMGIDRKNAESIRIKKKTKLNSFSHTNQFDILHRLA